VPDGWSFLGYVLIIGAAVLMFGYSNRRTGTNSEK
jgi:hypothetical protein